MLVFPTVHDALFSPSGDISEKVTTFLEKFSKDESDGDSLFIEEEADSTLYLGWLSKRLLTSANGGFLVRSLSHHRILILVRMRRCSAHSIVLYCNCTVMVRIALCLFSWVSGRRRFTRFCR